MAQFEDNYGHFMDVNNDFDEPEMFLITGQLLGDYLFKLKWGMVADFEGDFAQKSSFILKVSVTQIIYRRYVKTL